MDKVLELMKQRSSVRDYKPYLPAKDQMESLKLAALYAPTSLDLQEQRFFFITDPGLLLEMEENVREIAGLRGENDYLERLKARRNKVFFGAPLVVVIAVKRSNNYTDVDAGIAVQNLALAAKSLGLDSVIMAAPDRIFTGSKAAYFCDRLGIEVGYRFAISIAIGSAAAPKEPHTLKPENIITIGKNHTH